MKKSLLILSLLALTATSARAFDTLEPGTADSPNYYLIKSNSGRYVSYSADEISVSSSVTHLEVVDSPVPASLWAVTSGSAANTFTIKNYTAEQYLVQYQLADGTVSSDNATGSFANTAASPVNIYTNSLGNGVYNLKTSSNNYDYYSDGNGGMVWKNYLLKSTADQNTLVNAWSDDANCNFTVYKVTIPEGGDAQSAIDATLTQALFTDAKDHALSVLQAYIQSVPVCAETLTPAVAQIEAISYSENGVTEVNSAFNSAVAAANTVLRDYMSGKVFALENLRRANRNNASYGAFASLNEAANGFGPATTTESPATWFKFEPYAGVEGSFRLVNMSDNSMVDYNAGPLAPSSSSFIAVLPQLNNNSGFYGISFKYTDSGNGFNMNNNPDSDGNTVLTSYGINDGGSIWNIVNIWDTYAQPSIDELNAYVGACSATDQVFTSAISSIEALGYTADLVTKPAEIATQAENDANETLKTALNGKVYSLKSLRRVHCNNTNAQGTPYFGLNVTSGQITSNSSDSEPIAWFEFTSTENGGYTVKNYYNGQYVFTATGEDGAYGVATTSETESTPVYPTLISNGSYAGIAFPYTTGGKGFNVNENTPTSLTSWQTVGNDKDGSIWAINEIADAQTNAQTYLTTNCGYFDSFAANVPSAADIFTAAKPEAEKIEAGAGAYTKIDAVLNDAMSEGTVALATALVEKNVSLHGLRNGYICAGEDGFSVSAEQSDWANYDFAPAEEGGFTLYSPAAEKYIGPAVVVGNEANMTLVADKADAQVVYPVCYHSGNYCGVAFPFSDSTNAGTQGFNANGTGLHQYRIGDGGSIFAVKVMGNSTGIEEVTVAPAAQGIYDLSGRRLSAPVKGINIINGHKVLVK